MKIETDRTGGFTLFELLVVMGIIAVMAALIMPRIGGGIANLKLRSEVRTCSAVMRYAKSVAVSTQKEQKVIFFLQGNPEERDYYIYYKVTRESGQETEEMLNEEEENSETMMDLKHEEKRKELDSGISLRWRTHAEMDWEDEGKYEIIFSSRGFVTGGEIQFAFTDKERFYILKIDPVTGRVKTLSEKE
jgi:prepilin-type N-terminal cleavage/methylation domain-containing protein